MRQRAKIKAEYFVDKITIDGPNDLFLYNFNIVCNQRFKTWTTHESRRGSCHLYKTWADIGMGNGFVDLTRETVQ